MNHSVIGKQSIVGSNTRIERTAEGYVQRARRYKAELKAQAMPDSF
jgi:hypothetical protein